MAGIIAFKFGSNWCTVCGDVLSTGRSRCPCQEVKCDTKGCNNEILRTREEMCAEVRRSTCRACIAQKKPIGQCSDSTCQKKCQVGLSVCIDHDPTKLRCKTCLVGKVETYIHTESKKVLHKHYCSRQCVRPREAPSANLWHSSCIGCGMMTPGGHCTACLYCMDIMNTASAPVAPKYDFSRCLCGQASNVVQTLGTGAKIGLCSGCFAKIHA
jgi:hypothetical protein